MVPEIELDGVFFSARGRTLVSGASLRLERGKTAALVGPSGGGKSTVLKLAAGLLVPDRGEARFRGRRISSMGRQENLAFRRKAAFVFQDAALWSNMTLFQTLELPLRVHFPSMSSRERGRKVAEAAAEVGYGKDLTVRPSELSRGEQKLIAFARAAICSPSLLFLDEWTESLDEKSARRLVDLVVRARDAGATVVFVSHDARIVGRLADEVLLVAAGAIAVRLAGEEVSCEEDLGRLLELGAA